MQVAYLNVWACGSLQLLKYPKNQTPEILKSKSFA